MNNNELGKIVDNLLNTFLDAGKIAKDIAHKGVKITIKSDNTPVTNGDLAVNKMLCEKILSLTPNIPIISEETVDISKENKNKNFWLIDPIDGTKDYINKKDEYTLNAALIVDFKPALGIIYAPEKDRLFYSYGSGKAYEINGGVKTTLTCSKKTKIGKIFAVHSSNNISPEILEVHKQNSVFNCIKMSSSLKFCIIAAGEIDIYAAKARAFEWDIAAGHAIVEHSGGSVTTLGGKNISYGKKDYKNPAIIVKRSNKLDR